jgi:hypothetical protein
MKLSAKVILGIVLHLDVPKQIFGSFTSPSDHVSIQNTKLIWESEYARRFPYAEAARCASFMAQVHACTNMAIRAEHLTKLTLNTYGYKIAQ